MRACFIHWRAGLRSGSEFIHGFAVLLLTSFCFSSQAAAPPKPNVLFILADDMGFSDAGCYGGEIQTPNLDRLAKDGLRFTQFYNTARCWPTRAALLTGYYPQQIRMDPPRGRLPDWAKLLPHHLKPLGYRSYHSGKWHVNGAPKPVADGGFDRSYMIGDDNRNFAPRTHFENDEALPPVAENAGYYTTIAYADKLLAYLKDHARDHSAQPFFAYLAFTIPHFPLHALPEDIARYRDQYLTGWDELRERRWKRARDLKIVNSSLPPREPDIAPHWNLAEEKLLAEISPHEVARAVAWNGLNDEQKKFQATKMAIHAAMIDRMDREIGRVLEQLKAMGAFENTIVMFASDNGASAEFINRGDKHDPNAAAGSAGSYLCLGPGWSTAANSPFRLHKSWVHEGGIATPFIVHWPKGISARNELRRTPGHVIDFVPTILELAGGSVQARLEGTNAPPFSGRSLVGAFPKDRAVKRDFLYFQHDQNRALRVDDWKLVAGRPRTNDWELYDLGSDRAEQKNLAGKHPARVREMSAKWLALENEFRAQAGPWTNAAAARNQRRAGQREQ